MFFQRKKSDVMTMASPPPIDQNIPNQLETATFALG